MHENTWQHLIFVINAITFQIYLNGELIESGSKTDYILNIANNGLVLG